MTLIELIYFVVLVAAIIKGAVWGSRFGILGAMAGGITGLLAFVAVILLLNKLNDWFPYRKQTVDSKDAK